MNSKKQSKQIYFGIFIFFVVLSCLISLSSGDDYDWGGPAGLERLKNGFTNYNGRYLGHLVTLTITRFSFIRVIVYASINTTIIYLINHLTHSKHNNSIYLTLITLLLIPTNIYAQTFGWYAGFSNYNVGMCLLLIVWSLLFSKTSKWYISMGIVIFSFMSQLFMENITLFNIISSFCFLILFMKDISLIKRVSYIIGSISGALIMFSNSVYHNISNGTDSYRAINWNNLITVYFTTFTQYFMVNNWLLVTLISFVALNLLDNIKNKVVIQSSLIAYPVILILLKQAQVTLYYAPFIFLVIINFVTLVYLLTLVYVVVNQKKSILWKKKLIFVGFGSGIILAPFLVIQPFGPRAAFTSYILLSMLFLYLYNHSLDIQKKVFSAKLFLPVATSLCFGLIAIHGSNFYVNKVRTNNMIINDQAKTISVSQVPFGQFEHWINPPGFEFAHTTFKNRFDLPKDYDLIVTPFKDTFFQK